LALLPGFAFPFVLSWFLGAADADRMLLAGSVALTLTSVVGTAVELNSVSEISRCLGQGQEPSQRSLRQYRRRVSVFVVVTTAVVGTVLIVLYGLQRGSITAFAPLALVMLLVPIFGGVASARSGELIARGTVVIPILLQSCRTVIPTALVLLHGEATHLSSLAVAFAVGEFARLAVLTAMTRGSSATVQGTSVTVPTNGLLWQSGSALTSQTGPVTDRFFLSTGQTGALSSYEMADKLFFAAIQLVNLGFITSRLSQWARLPTMSYDRGRRLLRRDTALLLVIAAAFSGAGSGSCLLLPGLLSLPEAWHRGFAWAAILFLAMPFSIGILCCSRLLIIARCQKLLIRFAIWTAVGNALLDWLFFTSFGAVGIVMATVVARLVSLIAYLWVIRKKFTLIFASDQPNSTAATSADTSMA
jgi:peptidoglycan biosynthesis protein MviN/MurJ (putative lipid II flippase)